MYRSSQDFNTELFTPLRYGSDLLERQWPIGLLLASPLLTLRLPRCSDRNFMGDLNLAIVAAEQVLVAHVRPLKTGLLVWLRHRVLFSLSGLDMQCSVLGETAVLPYQALEVVLGWEAFFCG